MIESALSVRVMRRKRRLAMLLSGICLGACASNPLVQTAQSGSLNDNCAVVAGENVQVSHNTPNSSILETQIAVDPTDGRNLIASVTTRTGTVRTGDLRWAEAYRSNDGGVTWSEASRFFEFSADTNVIFDRDGRAYFFVIAGAPAVNHVFLSEDKGQSWRDLPTVPRGQDRWQVAADLSRRPEGGSVFAFGLENTPPTGRPYSLTLLRTRDHGNTWQRETVTDTNALGIPADFVFHGNFNPTFSDGDVFLPFYTQPSASPISGWDDRWRFPLQKMVVQLSPTRGRFRL